MDLLLNQVLVLGVVGVNDHDGLPATLAGLGVTCLEGGGGDQHGQRETLGVDTGLDKLLGSAQVLVTADDGQSDGHGGNPGREDDRVAVLAAPVHKLLLVAAGLLGRLEDALGLVLVKVHWVLGFLEGDGVALGGGDGAKRGCGRDEEGAEGQGQAAEGCIAARGGEDAGQAEAEADRAAHEAALEDLIVVGLFLFFADDLHRGWCLRFRGWGGLLLSGLFRRAAAGAVVRGCGKVV